MRVLWLFDKLSPQMKLLAGQLNHVHGIELDVISRWDGDPPLDSSVFNQTDLECRSKLDFAARKAVRQQLENGNYDIAHAYTSRNLATLAAACRGLSRRLQVVGYRGTVTPLKRLDPANWITYWHPRVDRIICVCDATRRALERSGIAPEKLATVWSGCDPTAFEELGRSALAEFDIPSDAVVVGAVANMRPVKGLDLLLEAALELSDLTQVYWLLIGEVLDSRIDRLASDSRIRDRVRLPGKRQNGGKYTRLFDIYASPSRQEGLSMSIIEAMTMAACPVVSDIGGCPELIRDRQDGLVVPTENPHALATAIRTLVEDQPWRAELARSAQRRAGETFTVAAWAARLAVFYHELAGSAGPD
ncbi:glycosyltransferase [bacterium]|nr:glycosyltransferase [bacterium]